MKQKRNTILNSGILIVSLVSCGVIGRKRPTPQLLKM
jgi:hypothetical protein